MDVGVDGVIRLDKVAGIEQRLPHVLGVVAADGIGENRQQIIDTHPGWLHQLRIIQFRIHITRMNQAPAVSKSIGVVTLHMKSSLGIVLENGNRVVAAFSQEIDGLCSEQCRIKSVEPEGPSAALRMADFTSEDGLSCRIAAAVKLEILVAEHVD